jgi:glucose-1-phosphate thymidylyltransferase
VVIENSVVGPHVSIGAGTVIRNTIISNSIIQENTTISDAVLKDSMIGSHAKFMGKASDISLGDYSVIE